MNMIADNSFESLLKAEVSDPADGPIGDSQLEKFATSTGLLFLEPGREEALRLLGHLLRYSDQLIAFLGECGAGKNYLLRAFSDANSETLSCGFVRAEKFMSASALSACIGQKLADRLAYVGDLAEWSAQIVGWSQELEQMGSRAVIVIDDAQHLSESALEMLADLMIACEGCTGIRFVLIGTPELRQHLEHSRLVGQLLGKCHFIEIEPFDDATSAHFLSWSLSSHALSPDLFTADERRYILQNGKGLPGIIRETAIRVMDKGIPPLVEEEAPDTGAVTGLIRDTDVSRRKSTGRNIGYAACGLVLFVAILWVLFRPGSDGAAGGESAVASEVNRVSVPKIVALSDQAPPEAFPISSPALTSPGATGANAGSDSQPLAAQPGVSEESGLGSTSPRLPAESPAAGPTASVSQNLTDRDEFLATREAAPSGPRSADWLLEKSPETYVLQLLGTHSEAGAQRYIAEQKSPEQFALFATKMNGKPWYVVVYGHHPDRAAALTAIGKLPKELRDRKPWARSLESVHKAILEGRHA